MGKPGEGSEELLNSIRPGYVSFVINTRTVLSGMHYGNGVAIRPALRSTTLGRTIFHIWDRAAPDHCSQK